MGSSNLGNGMEDEVSHLEIQFSRDARFRYFSLNIMKEGYWDPLLCLGTLLRHYVLIFFSPNFCSFVIVIVVLNAHIAWNVTPYCTLLKVQKLLLKFYHTLSPSTWKEFFLQRPYESRKLVQFGQLSTRKYFKTLKPSQRSWNMNYM